MQKFYSFFSHPLRVPMLAAGIFLPLFCGQANAAGPTATVAKASKGSLFVIGKASWYGLGFRGQKTASGETFDANQLTAAHRTLPMGSLVRVTNLRNRKSVIVKINDRGPYVGSRVLDLSRAAARLLGFSGTASVKMEVVSSPRKGPAMVSQLSPAMAH